MERCEGGSNASGWTVSNLCTVGACLERRKDDVESARRFANLWVISCGIYEESGEKAEPSFVVRVWMSVGRHSCRGIPLREVVVIFTLFFGFVTVSSVSSASSVPERECRSISYRPFPHSAVLLSSPSSSMATQPAKKAIL